MMGNSNRSILKRSCLGSQPHPLPWLFSMVTGSLGQCHLVLAQRTWSPKKLLVCSLVKSRSRRFCLPLPALFQQGKATVGTAPGHPEEHGKGGQRPS